MARRCVVRQDRGLTLDGSAGQGVPCPHGRGVLAGAEGPPQEESESFFLARNTEVLAGGPEDVHDRLGAGFA